MRYVLHVTGRGSAHVVSVSEMFQPRKCCDGIEVSRGRLASKQA